MNLREKLTWKSSMKELDVLLEEPFEIDAEIDFPLLYVINFNIRCIEQEQRFRKLRLPENKKERVWIAVAYDYSPSHKIVLSSIYHQLAREGISERALEDTKKMREGILFFMHGMYHLQDTIPLKDCQKLWPEFAQYPALEKEAYAASERLKTSPENERILEIVDAVKRRLGASKEDFDAWASEKVEKPERAYVPGYKHGARGVKENDFMEYLLTRGTADRKELEKDERSYLYLRGTHDFGTAINNVDMLFRK